MTDILQLYDELTQAESIVRGYYKLGCHVNPSGSDRTPQQISNDIDLPVIVIEQAIKSLKEKGLI